MGAKGASSNIDLAGTGIQDIQHVSHMDTSMLRMVTNINRRTKPKYTAWTPIAKPK